MYAKLQDKKFKFTQSSSGTSNSNPMKRDFVTPGPGAYETNPSSVENK